MVETFFFSRIVKEYGFTDGVSIHFSTHKTSDVDEILYKRNVLNVAQTTQSRVRAYIITVTSADRIQRNSKIIL